MRYIKKNSLGFHEIECDCGHIIKECECDDKIPEWITCDKCLEMGYVSYSWEMDEEYE